MIGRIMGRSFGRLASWPEVVARQSQLATQTCLENFIGQSVPRKIGGKPPLEQASSPH